MHFARTEVMRLRSEVVKDLDKTCRIVLLDARVHAFQQDRKFLQIDVHPRMYARAIALVQAFEVRQVNGGGVHVPKVICGRCGRKWTDQTSRAVVPRWIRWDGLPVVAAFG